MKLNSSLGKFKGRGVIVVNRVQLFHLNKLCTLKIGTAAAAAVDEWALCNS